MTDFEKLWIYDHSNLGWMLRGFSRRNEPLPMRRSIEVLPGVYTYDDRLLQFIRQLSKELNEHPALKPELDTNSMVSANGVHTSFDRLRTVAGFASNPLGWISTDNTLLCDSLGLPQDFRNARHRMIFDEFFDLVWGSWKPTSIKVPKHSTMGLPLIWQYDANYKRAASVHLYKNASDVFSMIGRHEWEALADKYGIIFCYNLNRRGQVDEPGKERKVNSLEYALSGGRSGERLVADKHVVLPDGREYPDFSATRERVVQGASWFINCMLQPISSGTMYALFHEYPTVFHHTDPQDIADAAFHEGDATFSDVSQYDETMREFLLRRMFQRQRTFWPEHMVDAAEILYFAPYFSRPLDADGVRRGRFVGNPMNPIGEGVIAGNRSGHAFTSLVAKTMKVFDSLCVIDDIYKDVVGNVHHYLKDRGAIKLKNNGDDEGAIGSPTAIEAYRKVRYDGQHGYFKIEPEKGQGFSGTLIRWKDTPLAIPRLHTSLEKIYCPERPIGGIFRPRWPIGLLARLEAMEKHPVGHFATEIHRKLWHDMMQPHYGSFGDLLSGAMEQLPVQYDGLTSIEKEVLDDPEKLYYKYSDDDVSQAVLEEVCVRIHPSEFPWAQAAYKGRLV